MWGLGQIPSMWLHLQGFGVNLGPLLSVIDQSAGVTPVQDKTGNSPSAYETLSPVLLHFKIQQQGPLICCFSLWGMLNALVGGMHAVYQASFLSFLPVHPCNSRTTCPLFCRQGAH